MIKQYGLHTPVSSRIFGYFLYMRDMLYVAESQDEVLLSPFQKGKLQKKTGISKDQLKFYNLIPTGL